MKGLEPMVALLIVRALEAGLFSEFGLRSGLDGLDGPNR